MRLVFTHNLNSFVFYVLTDGCIPVRVCAYEKSNAKDMITHPSIAERKALAVSLL